MKKLSIFFAFIVLSSFTFKTESNVLPNGFYKAVLDEEFKKMELNDFEFTILDNKFTRTIDDKLETLELEWLDENSFVVKGYTEPASPDKFEQKMINEYRPSFNIIKISNNEYYFTLAEESEEQPIFSGRFVKLSKK